MSKQAVSIIITALFTSAIFILILAAQLDLIFMFLATLPLFAAGLSKDPRIALKAGALSTLPIAMLTGSSAVVLIFFLIFVLPTWYICDAALRYYDLNITQTTTPIPTLRLWYPMGLITVNLAVYGCVILAVITAIFATQETNLPQQLNAMVQGEVATISSDLGMEIDLNNRDMSFMICGLMIWIWGIFLLTHAWLTNRSLVKKKIAKRHSLMITPFPIPNWLLTLIGICALASLIGGESMRFLGKSCLIILMLPYFFQGAALIHIRLMNLPNRRFLLFFMYATIVVLFWPALFIIGIGFWDHIKILNKHLSSGGTSSRS